MKTWIFILGHSPALSAEEILAVLFPAKSDILSLTEQAMVLQADLNPVPLLDRLGGTIKIAEVIHTMPRATVIRSADILRLMSTTEDAKLVFGYSLYGVPPAAARYWQRAGLEAKRKWQEQGRKVRLVANRQGLLSSVAVAKNKLVDRELVVVSDGQKTYVGLTRVVQHFEDYGARDYGRPSRDSARGMLPPKLAQMMINFSSCKTSARLLDPFCGAGTVLQEAALMGYRNLTGTDIDAKAITMVEKNILWLQRWRPEVSATLLTLPAASLSEKFPADSFDLVVTEPFLGPARELQRELSPARIKEIEQQLIDVYSEAIRQINRVLTSHGTLVMVWPVFFQATRSRFLPLLYEIPKGGWTFVKPRVGQTVLARHLSSRGTLVYRRPGQAVGREITVWKKSK